MSSDTQGPWPATQGSAPYPPQNIGLGGIPEVKSDVPITAVFLVLYLIFGVIHIKIFKSNKSRGHKFIFNGAILGLCKIRIITMSLRIAWACYPRNVGLGIAANVFVYVGTIILYMVNWFFVQRIIRAQHTKLGWSMPYRIFHRGALSLLVVTLIMLIIASIWQSFTLDTDKLRIFRALFLTGQTYFTAFCIAPAVLVLLSLIIPRTEIEKFGAGRLRINITILLVAVAVLSMGQVFRCILAWIPPTPLRNAQGQLVDTPWYLHKVCFYVFNFVPEIIVIVVFAVVRVDLRFHVPNGSKIAGDYSGRNSRYTINEIDSEKDPEKQQTFTMAHQNNSSDTLHEYETSIFEDTHTLADSLKYGSSTLEVDQKTGNWKVKRTSTGSTSSRASIQSSRASRSSITGQTTPVNDIPPVPEIPAAWPLPDSRPLRSSVPLLVHSNPTSRRATPKRTFEIRDGQLNNVNVGDAVSDALTKLEMNSEKKKLKISTSPRYYKCCNSPVEVYRPTLPVKNDNRRAACPACRKQRKRSTYPPNSALNVTRQRDDTHSSCSSANGTPTIIEAPELPHVKKPEPTATSSHSTNRSSGSLEIISLVHGQNVVPRRILDVSLHAADTDIVAESENGDSMAQNARAVVSRTDSPRCSDVSASSNTRYATAAQEEFRRFSFEASPVSPIGDMRHYRAAGRSSRF
ncbi:hypothetical protein BKA66DRAFT_465762 [Pyrenochaeta sp. MPI-SDFR-AT-0127]|nr:hypothetical protein BKA66DRAFT_465762 [Pyrenochaeta sp. MPI-SDFR-AT-0127]